MLTWRRCDNIAAKTRTVQQFGTKWGCPQFGANSIAAGARAPSTLTLSICRRHLSHLHRPPTGVLRTRHWKTPYRNGRRTCESADADAATDAFVDEAAIFHPARNCKRLISSGNGCVAVRMMLYMQIEKIHQSGRRARRLPPQIIRKFLTLQPDIPLFTLLLLLFAFFLPTFFPPLRPLPNTLFRK